MTYRLTNSDLNAATAPADAERVLQGHFLAAGRQPFDCGDPAGVAADGAAAPRPFAPGITFTGVG